MFSLRDGFKIAMLLALMQASAFASLKEDEENQRNLAKILVNSMDVPLIDGMKSVIGDSNITSLCATDLELLTEAFASGEIWALEMLDASSKIQSGILNGNLRDLGMYGQCIQANGRYNDTDLRAKHCTIRYRVSYEGNLTDIGNASVSLGSAICVPSSCDVSDAVEIATAAYERLTEYIDTGLKLNVTSAWCARIESEDYSVGEILTIVFFALTGIILVFCTICDFLKRSVLVNVKGPIDTLAKFSLYKNALSILSTKKAEGLMPSLQGMRFFCMCWIILGHRYVTALFKPTVNLAYLPAWGDTLDAIYIQTAPFAVDTFFVISGFLMTYQYFKALQSGRRINIPMLYVQRYLRLTPALAVVILFVVFLIHRIGNGPVWNALSLTLINRCKKNWWVNLLYLQNYVDTQQMCLGHSWYLAVDMQLFWISPIFLYPLYRWPRYGLMLLTCVLGVSIATPTALVAIHNYYNAIVRFDMSDPTFDSFFKLYIPTYNRACAYFVGVFLGYDVAIHKRQPRKAFVVISWIMTLVGVVFCIWITHITHKTHYEYNKPLEIGSALILRPIWSAASAWLVFATTQGYGGILTRLLSIPLFLPVSRLSYCIYLVHMVVQFTKNAAVQIPDIYLPFPLFNEFLADLFLSIIVAFFLSLFFESPIVILTKLLMNRGRRPKRPALVQEPRKDVEKGVDNKALSSEL